jgi:hypothetical protein
MNEGVAERELGISYIDPKDKERLAEAILKKEKFEEEALKYMKKLKDENDALISQIDNKLAALGGINYGSSFGGFTLLPSR